MKSVLVYYPSNFWESNPDFLIHPTFKEFSKDKNSSNIMWAFSFILERRDNMYAELPEEERKKVIAVEVIGDKKFDWKKHDKVFNLYKDLRTSVIDRQLISLAKKLEEREEFLNNTPYTLESAKLLDGLIISTESLIDKYNALLARLYSDGDDVGMVQGDMKESFLETE